MTVSAHRQSPARAAASARHMECLISLLVLLPAGAVSRLAPFSGGAYRLYGDASAEEYEPYAVAALPLHPPVPVLQVFSPGPRPRARPPARQRGHDAPASSPSAYEPVRYEPVRYEPVRYEPVRYDTAAFEPAAYESVNYEPTYAERDPQPKPPATRDQYEDEASSLVVYARPNKQGGYSYRRPAAPAPPPRPREPQHPVIIRIHKYRVVH